MIDREMIDIWIKDLELFKEQWEKDVVEVFRKL